ncbi:hypothetical protein K2173_009812 [Erythroxylum novogranatense]|uniref:VQ domain-containing protein n=1 Tax=Erythroxylum novogranatense TaxID=1862640 RepID=A0AAV8SYZ5_9ROSI|nr:hypothetical protein K2173_009812 [Erythroxylum novogranatense]
MSKTMSSPGDRWGQFYHHQQSNLSNQQVPPGRTVFGNERVSDATVVTTTVTATSTPILPSNPSSSGGHLSPEGRVSKPIRRRSRASRRTPTTLLNTDTTNFRAMVQQFTGGPSAPYAPGTQLNGPSFSFGLGLRQGQANNVNPVMVPASVAGYHLQFQHHQQQQQQHYQLHNQPQSYMFSLGNNSSNNNNNNTTSAHDFFLQRQGNVPRSTSTSMELAISDGFLMEGVPPQQLPPAHHHLHLPSSRPPSFPQ